MPDLNKIASELHDEVTANGEGQLVKEIAGRIVGRLPANLAKIFRKLMKDFGLVVEEQLFLVVIRISVEMKILKNRNNF